MRMRFNGLRAVVFLAVLGLVPVLAEADPPLRVVGMDDAALDGPNLRQAVAEASDGATIWLEGTFQLDSESIFLTQSVRIRGVKVDDDGDGETNEDWADGIDNDGDGAVDEDGWDAHLKGVLDADGNPIGTQDGATVVNRAFFVRGLSGVVSDIRIQDLRLSGFSRALTVEPDTGSTGGTQCSQLFSTDGVLEGLRVEHNRFDGNTRTIEMEGEVSGARIRRNRIESSSNFAVIIEGGTMGCQIGDGTFGQFPIGRPVATEISDNVFTATGIALLNSGAEATEIEGNEFRDSNIGILSENDPAVEIEENLFADLVFALILGGAVDDAEVEENRFERGLFAIIFDPGASGWEVLESEFVDVGFFEVIFDDGTTDNLVVVPVGARVLDFGVGNTVIFE